MGLYKSNAEGETPAVFASSRGVVVQAAGSLHVVVLSLWVCSACSCILAWLSHLSLNIPSHARKFSSREASVNAKITFERPVYLVRPGIPEVERGDGVSVGFQ